MVAGRASGRRQIFPRGRFFPQAPCDTISRNVYRFEPVPAWRCDVIYEERIYTIMPGKMGDIERRFADQTMRLFEKHGIKVTGFWKTAIGRQNLELVYILEYRDMNDRMQK